MGRPVRILIVEDDAVIALDMHEMLLRMGHEVTGVARDEAGAVKISQATAPALALVDFYLASGKGSGDLTQKLRAEWNTPTLFISGSPEACRDVARLDGVLGCLSKPFTEEELAAAISIVEAIISGRRPAPPPSSLQIYSYVF
jgi:two-component system, response regulator PdtaR